MMEVVNEKLNQTTVAMGYLSDQCLMSGTKSPVLQLAVDTSVINADATSINPLKEGDDKWEEKDELNTTCDVHSSDVELKGLKRKRSMLTLRTKLEIIERIKKGEKVTKLALEYGLGKATVSDMKRQEEKIMSFISKSSCGLAVEKRKTMRKPQDVHVEKALFMWLNRERKKGSVISGPALMEKAKSFHKQLYGNESSSFKASSGWLHRFKLRNGIKQPRVAGSGRTKKLLENENSAIQFQLDVLRRMIQDHMLGSDQIYTVSINRLHWKALPFKLKRRCKSCVTVLTCVNASGSLKLRPSLIGRTEMTKILGDDVNVDRLPYRYYCQENGWVDAELFQSWFQEELVPQLQLYYSKALLLLDDTLFNLDQSPLTNDDGKYVCISVPSIISFVVQPINNYLFDTLKFRYRTQMVEYVSTYPSTKRSSVRFAELNRCLTLRDAGYILSEAWDSVVGDVIKRFWMNTLYCLGAVDEQAVVVDDLLNKVPEISSASCEDAKEESWKQMMVTLRNYDRNVTEDDVADWIALDGENLGESCVMTDKDIIECVRCELTDAESEEDVGEAVDDGVTVPTSSEAYTCFNKCLSWLERQKDCETSHLQLLWKLQNVAAKRKSKR